MRRPRPLLAGLALLAALVSGCVSSGAAALNVLDARVSKERPSTYMGLPLRTGQLILSESPDPSSLLFAMGPTRFYRFTHAAILVIEDGEPVVYDMSGDYTPGCHERPTDAISGGLRRFGFIEYCSPNLYMEVYDPPEGVDVDEVAGYLQRRYREGVAFDPYFDIHEQRRLFCTELIELALRAGGAAPRPPVPVRVHRSLHTLLRWFRIPTDIALPAGIYADPGRYVGALGQLRSLTAARCYFEAKRQLYRRFTDDQRLGHLFVLRPGPHIDLRPEIQAFYERAVHRFDGARFAPDPREVRRAIAELASEFFVPFGDGPT